jgi:putative inorganic carbon (HCO3(-)) transporter
MNKTEIILKKIILASLYGSVFVVPIYFAFLQENYTVFDLNKSAALRFFISMALLAWLWLAARSGKIRLFASRQLAFAWGLLIAAFFVSSLLSLHPNISWLGSYERQQGFINLLSYLLIFYLIATFINNKRRFNHLLFWLLAAAAVASIYGLMQALGLDFLRWAESSLFRIFSTFGQPNFFGHYLVVCLPLTIYAAVFLARHCWHKILFAILAAVELACLVLTYSRSAWVAFAVSLIVAGLAALWYFGRKKIALTSALAALIIFIILSLAPVRSAIFNSVDYKPTGLVFRLVTIFDFKIGSAGTRLFYWQAAWQAFKNAPLERQLFGFGPDVQASVFVSEYRPIWAYYERMNSFPDRAHNAPLDFLLQFGLVGAATFTLLLYFIMKPFFKRWRSSKGEDYWLGLALMSSLLAYGVNNLFSFSLTAMTFLLYVLLALALNYGHQTLNRELKLNFFQPASRYIIASGTIILLGVLFYGYSLRPMVADAYYMKVKRAEARGDCRQVLDNMEKVLEWYPVSHYYARIYLHHAVNCFSAASSEESRQQIARNIIDQAATIPERETQFYTLIDLAHAYSILGYYIDSKYYEQAEKAYLRLLDINKYITVTYQDYARMKLWQGDYETGRRLLNDGIAVTPSPDEAPPFSGHNQAISRQLAYFHDLLGLSYYSQGDFAKAKAEYETALKIDPTLPSPRQKLEEIKRVD